MEYARNIPNEIPDDFWEIVDRARPLYPDYKPVFADLDEIDIIRFAWNYEEAVCQLRCYFESTDEFPEDSVMDFCYRAVAQGAEFYAELWDQCSTEPSGILNSALQHRSDPGVYTAATTVFHSITGEEVPAKEGDRFYG